MCKHVLNAQVSIRAPCCKKWFDCAECHKDTADHELQKTDEMVFVCKKCKKVFRRNMREWDEDADEYCPGCDNHFVVEAKTPESNRTLVIGFEGTNDMVIDERMKSKTHGF